MNEMKKKMKIKKKIEEKKDLMIVKLQKEEDTLMKMIIEEMSIHIH
jgi:DNA-directed RNA polymerase subunit L